MPDQCDVVRVESGLRCKGRPHGNCTHCAVHAPDSERCFETETTPDGYCIECGNYRPKGSIYVSSPWNMSPRKRKPHFRVLKPLTEYHLERKRIDEELWAQYEEERKASGAPMVRPYAPVDRLWDLVVSLVAKGEIDHPEIVALFEEWAAQKSAYKPFPEFRTWKRADA